MATGASTRIDPRVAPEGTVRRVTNMRVDPDGRLVPRNGYAAYGTSVAGDAFGSLVPFDLHSVDGQLVVLGNQRAINQIGIRAPYRLADTAQGTWVTEFSSGATSLMALPAADRVRRILASNDAVDTDSHGCDCAISTDGAFLAIVSERDVFGRLVDIVVIDTSTNEVVKQTVSSFNLRNPRVLCASGSIFLIFMQDLNTNVISVATLDMSTPFGSMSGLTAVSTGVSAAPSPYDVAVYEGSTDFLIAYATASGYTWRRYNSSIAQQSSTNVTSLANAPVSICGASGENISVVNVRTTDGVEIRTFTPAGALAVGPTNVDNNGLVYSWVSVTRVSSTLVHVLYWRTAPAARRMSDTQVTIATHALVQRPDHLGMRPVTKALLADGLLWTIETMGDATPAPYVLVALDDGTVAHNNAGSINAVLMDGLAQVDFGAETVFRQCNIVRRPGTTDYYVALIARDPRDKGFRVHVLSFGIFSGRRRQGVVSGGSLYLSGGIPMQFDRRLSVELGIALPPLLSTVAAAATASGALTASSTYTIVTVWRHVASDGSVTQSAPSAPVVQATGSTDDTISFNVFVQPGRRFQNGFVYLDVYRTEANGTIPRLSQSLLFKNFDNFLGIYTPVLETNADAIVQAGATLYTQGASGAVSGRLPLAAASPCELIAESDGRLYLGRLETPSELQLSIEKRPGESQGFVSDDLFFVTNPEEISALVSAEGGRRLVLGASNIRELIGQGPNSAGVGELSEPTEVENRIGCFDWRSVVKTEHGIFFGYREGTSRTRIYLMPRGGSVAIEAGEGIQDVLDSFPVITSASRTEDDQTVTFTLQDDAGTNGRIVHMDLASSGIGQDGFVGRWIVDRFASCEGQREIEIVERTWQSKFVPVGVGGVTQVTAVFDLPRGKRVGDTLIMIVGLQLSTTQVPSTPSGWTVRATLGTGGVDSRLHVYSRTIADTTAEGLQSVSLDVQNLATTTGVAVTVRIYLLRGATGDVEVTSLGSTSLSSWPLPTLAPTWGSAKTLWITAGHADIGFTQAPNTGAARPVWRLPPSGFGGHEFRTFRQQVSGDSYDIASAERQLQALSLSGATWTTATISGHAVLIAVRPSGATTGTPVRASVEHNGRLVVCNSATVFRADPTLVADLGTTYIDTEWESCDLYPMGTGGEGRVLSLVLFAELLGFCAVEAAASYDGGLNWVSMKRYRLTNQDGYAVGQSVRLQWVPRRRRVRGVRFRVRTFRDNQAAGLNGSGSGLTAGLAMMRASVVFDELVGPTRLAGYQRGEFGT